MEFIMFFEFTTYTPLCIGLFFRQDRQYLQDLPRKSYPVDPVNPVKCHNSQKLPVRLIFIQQHESKKRKTVSILYGCGIDQMQKVPYLNILPQTSEKCGFVMLTENTIVAMEKDSVDRYGI
jgi:hypothetical protein